MSGERVILTLLAQIALILALTRVMGWIFSRFRLGQVVGEMIGGILLGPSLLGWATPQFYARLFPQETLPVLAVLAQIGAVFYIFLIALELDLSALRKRISWAAGTLVAWSILAAVVLIARHSMHSVLATAIYVLAMAFLIRPLLKRLQLIHEQRGRLGHNMLAAILLMLVASAFATQAIGLHALFGALILGVIMPKEPKFIRQLTEKFRDFTLVFLLPIFFAYIGLNTDFSTLKSPWLWGLALIVLAAACAGSFLTARIPNMQ